MGCLRSTLLAAVSALFAVSAPAAPPVGDLALPRVVGERLLPAEPVLDGRTATLVVVFATWCRPCRDEVPVLNRIARDLQGRGVRVVAISVDEASRDVVARFAAEHAVAYPIYVADVAMREGRSIVGVVEHVPAMVLLSAHGLVLRRWVGPVGEGPLRAALAPLLGH